MTDTLTWCPSKCQRSWSYSMSFHVRVLRRVLLLGSVLTLTGIHREGASLPVGWRLSQLVPISLMAASFASLITNIAILQHVHDSLVGLCFGIGSAMGFLMLLWYIRRRERLHLLLRQVAELELLEGHLNKPGDTTFLNRQMALLLTISIFIAVGMTVMLSTANFDVFLFMPLWVPESLSNGIGLAVVILIQLVVASVLEAGLMMFTLLVAGLADAAALQMLLIQRALLNVCRRDNTGETVNPIGIRSGQVNVTTGGAESQTVIQDKINHVPVVGWPDSNMLDDSAEPHGNDDGDVAPAVVQFRRQSERYRLVHQLVSDTADAFSAPLLWLHAAVAAILLLAGYISAVKLTGRADVATKTELLYLVMMNWLTSLSVVAVSGSRLIQQSEELRDVVAKQCWSARMSSAARGELQVLLEQTRTPLALDVWGLFSVQKSVLLSVLSFVLTYFVIMLQMIR